MKFTVPKAFRALHRAGRFDYYGAPYASLPYAELVKRAAARRHSVLWFFDVEWDRSPADIERKPEDKDALPGLVAFASNGAGDHYSWYLPWQEGPEPPVVFCPHDEDEGTYFAPDFAGCLERFWLQYGAYADEDDEGHDVPADLAAWLEIIQPHLPPARAKKLEKLLKKPRAKAFEAEDDRRAKEFTRGRQPLEGPNLKSTEYDLEYLGKDALRLYDDSIAFFERLVAEGHARFAKSLAATRRNRAKAVARLATPRKGRKK